MTDAGITRTAGGALGAVGLVARRVLVSAAALGGGVLGLIIGLLVWAGPGPWWAVLVGLGAGALIFGAAVWALARFGARRAMPVLLGVATRWIEERRGRVPGRARGGPR